MRRRLLSKFIAVFAVISLLTAFINFTSEKNTANAAGQKVALLFGMEDYPGEINDLDGPANDMIGMEAVLEHSGYTVYRYNNESKSNLLSTVSSTASSLSAADTLMFVFSGHGNDGGYIIAADDGLIAISELESSLALHSGVKEVIIDACYSGDFISKDYQPEGFVKLESYQAFNDHVISVFSNSPSEKNSKALTESGYYVMTACSGDQLSYVYRWGLAGSPFAMGSLTPATGYTDEFNISYFCFFFEEGFGLYDGTPFSALWADSNSDNQLTWHELYTYAADNTSDDQQAQVYPLSSEHMVLSSVSLGTDSTLSDLVIDSSTITGFSSTTYSYDITVGNATESVDIGATATDGNATISGDTGTQSLSVGINTLTVTCTAEDGVESQDYTINITRESTASTDASLSDLTIDSSTITGFSSTTYSYDITVGNATESVDIGATATDGNATITGDTGTQSLSVGLNTFTVTCTAEDSVTSQDYILNITRESPLNTDASLSDLTIDSSTITGFSSSTYSYDITVGYATETVDVGATATDSNATITGDTGTQNLSVGLSTLTVTCTAEDGVTSQDYVLNITRESAGDTDASLSDLTIDSSTITGFSSNTYSYDITVENTTESVEIGATATDGNATITGYVGTQSLSVGLNTFTVTCTAADDVTSQDYVLNITRDVPVPEGLVFDSGTGTITDYTGSATDLVIPSMIDGVDVTGIGDYAFHNCSSLINVTLPDSISIFGDGAFRGCENLYGITLPSNITNISYYMFSMCYNLNTISIPSSVENIEAGAFYVCKNLDNVTIPDNVAGIGENAFHGCYQLSSINIPESVTSIGDGAFVACHSLTAFTVDSNNPNYTAIDGVLFTKDGTTLIQYKLGSIHSSYAIPASVIHVANAAFYQCTALQDIVFTDNIEAIGEFAFAECPNLEFASLSDNLTSIPEHLFQDCTSLASVTIPENVTVIGDYAFLRCDSLETINVSSNNANFKSVDGVLYTKDGQTLVQYPIGNARTSYVIASNTVNINNYAFYNCATLESATIPGSVTSIGEYAFFYEDINENVVPLTDFIIYGQAGSSAETYANTNGITFVAILELSNKTAILFGMADYDGTEHDLNGPVNDMIGMQAVLEHAGYTVYKYMNYTAADLLNTVQTVASNMPSDGTLLFAYSGHGSDGGYLVGTDFYGISINALESRLSLHTGVKEVIIDACYSGDFISKGVKVIDLGGAETPEDFNDHIISVFSGSESQLNSKDLAKSGYYVMTACSGSQLSYEYLWDLSDSPFAMDNLTPPEGYTSDFSLGYFSIYFQQGFGLYDSSPLSTYWADHNVDDIITWDELYRFAAYYTSAEQSAQVFPENSYHIFYQEGVLDETKLHSYSYYLDRNYSAIFDVPDETSLADFESTFSNPSVQIKIYDEGGTEITSGYVGTAMTAKLEIGSVVQDALDICVLGDINSDGIIDILDYSYVKLHIFEVNTLADVQFLAGDVDKSDVIDILDYTYIKLDIFDVASIN